MSEAAPVSVSRPADPRALLNFKNRILTEKRDATQHGIYIEALDSNEPVAAWNEDALFNPASVLKLATSLAALDTLGADYRFRTSFYANGILDARSGELQGDLVMVSGNDPSFSINDARSVGDALRRLGVRRINGSLVVVGNFTCNHNSQTDISAGVLRRNARLAFTGTTRYEEKLEQPGLPLFAVESDTLMHILQQQNAHSINAMADALGNHIGGAEAVKKFLVQRVNLPPDQVFISRTSGLEINRMTPRGTIKVLRSLVTWLKQHGYQPEDVMPVAGIDASTLKGRFAEAEYAGSVIAKTGTLHETDSGAAALAGIVLTRTRGPLLFVIYDMAEGRNVTHLRRVQDEFLKSLMEECGGPSPLPNHLENAVAYTTTSRVVFAPQGEPQAVHTE